MTPIKSSTTIGITKFKDFSLDNEDVLLNLDIEYGICLPNIKYIWNF